MNRRWFKACDHDLSLAVARVSIGWDDLQASGRFPIVDPRIQHDPERAPIIEVDEAAGTATCRSVYTVMQQAADGALQPVVCGRYHDRFARAADGSWHFVWRDYGLMDLVGDMSRHARSAALAKGSL